MRGRPYGRNTAAPNANPTPSKPPAPKPPQKPPQKPQQQPKPDPNNPVSSGKAANAVDGKDLRGKFHFDDNSNDYSIEQVIKAQGFDGKPTVTNDPVAFTAACKASNFIAKRGVGASNQATMDAYDQALKTGDFYVKCTGGNMHGYGMYAASVAANGSKAHKGVKDAESTANSYAGGGTKKIYTMTLDASAKIGTESSLRSQMQKDTEFQKICQASKLKSYYTQDVGVYAAYRGYDAYIAGSGRRANIDGSFSDYTVILNRSKVILFET